MKPIVLPFRSEKNDFSVSNNISREEVDGDMCYVFHYYPYEIAPSSFGMVDIKIPISQLLPYLRWVDVEN